MAKLICGSVQPGKSDSKTEKEAYQKFMDCLSDSYKDEMIIDYDLFSEDDNTQCEKGLIVCKITSCIYTVIEISDNCISAVIDFFVSGRTNNSSEDSFNVARLLNICRNEFLNVFEKCPPVIGAAFFPFFPKERHRLNPLNQKADFAVFKENIENSGFNLKEKVRGWKEALDKKGCGSVDVRNLKIAVESAKENICRIMESTAKDIITDSKGEEEFVIKLSESFNDAEASVFPTFRIEDDSTFCDDLILIRNKGFIITEVKSWREEYTSLTTDNRFRLKSYIAVPPAKQIADYRSKLIERLVKHEGFDNETAEKLVRCAVVFPYLDGDKNTDVIKAINFDCYIKKVPVLYKNAVSDSNILRENLLGLFDTEEICTGSTYTKCRRVLDPAYDELSSDESDYSVLKIWKYLDVNKLDEILNEWCMGTKQVHFVTDRNQLEAFKMAIAERMKKRQITFQSKGADAEFNTKILEHGKLTKEAENQIIDKNSNSISIFRFEVYIIPDGITVKDDIEVRNGLIGAGTKAFLDAVCQQQRKQTSNGLFNLEQFVVEHAPTDKHIPVLAGAGTGKTETMAARLSYLCFGVSESEVESLSGQVVLITFTNEAVDNMRERIKKVFRSFFVLTRDQRWLRRIADTENMQICTIHKFIEYICRSTSTALGVGSEFSVTSSDYRYRQILREKLSDKTEYDFPDSLDVYRENVIRKIAALRRDLLNKGVDPQNIDSYTLKALQKGQNEVNPLKDWFNSVNFKKVLGDTEKEFSANLRKYNELLLGEYALAFNKCVESDSFNANFFDIKYVMIDEFQDTDPLQISGFAKLQEKLGFYFFVVGDIKQMIYGFRGVSSNAFVVLKSQSPGWDRDYRLVLNYRTEKGLIDRFNIITGNLSGKSAVFADAALNSAKNGDCSYTVWDIDRNVQLGNDPYKVEPDSNTQNHVTANSKFFSYYINNTACSPEEMIIDCLAEIGNNPTGTLGNAMDKWKNFKNEDTVIITRRNSQLKDLVSAARKKGVSITPINDNLGSLYSSDAALDLYTLLRALARPNDTDCLYAFIQSAYIYVAGEHNNMFIPKKGSTAGDLKTVIGKYLINAMNTFREKNNDNKDAVNRISEISSVAAIVNNSGANDAPYLWDRICRRYSNEIITEGDIFSVLRGVYDMFLYCRPDKLIENFSNNNEIAKEYSDNYYMLLDTIAEDFKSPGRQLSLDALCEYMELKVQTMQTKKTEFTDDVSHKGLRCMTVHKSKGDEFDNVILLWDVAKEIPESLTIDNNNNINYSINGLTDIVESTTYVFRTRDPSDVDLIDEELRVLYVALTRAKKNLWVVLANTPPKNASDKKSEKPNNKLSAYSEILKLKK